MHWGQWAHPFLEIPRLVARLTFCPSAEGSFTVSGLSHSSPRTQVDGPSIRLKAKSWSDGVVTHCSANPLGSSSSSMSQADLLRLMISLNESESGED